MSIYHLNRLIRILSKKSFFKIVFDTHYCHFKIKINKNKKISENHLKEYLNIYCKSFEYLGINVLEYKVFQSYPTIISNKFISKHNTKNKFYYPTFEQFITNNKKNSVSLTKNNKFNKTTIVYSILQKLEISPKLNKISDLVSICNVNFSSLLTSKILFIGYNNHYTQCLLQMIFVLNKNNYENFLNFILLSEVEICSLFSILYKKAIKLSTLPSFMCLYNKKVLFRNLLIELINYIPIPRNNLIYKKSLIKVKKNTAMSYYESLHFLVNLKPKSNIINNLIKIIIIDIQIQLMQSM